MGLSDEHVLDEDNVMTLAREEKDDDDNDDDGGGGGGDDDSGTKRCD